MNILKKIKNYVGDIKICQNITSSIAGDISIFCYHKVSNLNENLFKGTPDEDLTINTKIFEKQIKYLVENFKVISAKDLNDIEKIKSLKEKKVVITFDDGYLDNLENALPILRKYNTSATIFITTNFIDNKELPWWDIIWEILNINNEFFFQGKKIRNIDKKDNKKKLFDFLKKKFFLNKKHEQIRLIDQIQKENNINLINKKKNDFLNKENIERLAKEKLINIGAHTHYHQNLGILNDDEKEKEIVSSKKILENITQKPIELFAYPYGTKNSYKISDSKILEKNNFKLAFTTEFNNYKLGFKSPFFIPRMGLGNKNDNKSIRDKVYGLDSLIKKFY